MRKITVFLACAGIFAAPANYNILTLNPSKSIIIDGSLSEWDDSYFIDSLRSGDNCYTWDIGWNWSTDKFNYLVYVAHDDAKVYFAFRTLHNYALVTGIHNSGCEDAFKINPGGAAMYFCIGFDGSIIVRPSSPYALGSTLFAAVNPTGNGNGLATAEFSLDKSVIDPSGIRNFQLSPGFENNDDLSGCMKCIYGCVGVEYTGNKQDWSSTDDNPLYYPTFYLVDSIPVIRIESVKSAEKCADFQVSPNPFNPAVTVEIPENLGASRMEIFRADGGMVAKMNITGKSRITWDASRFSAGVYVVRVVGEKETMEKRISYIK